MSRHITEGTYQGQAEDIVVGWDHPMMTFFVQVPERDPKAEREFALDRGGLFDQIYSLADFEKALASESIEISTEILGVLYADRDLGR